MISRFADNTDVRILDEKDKDQIRLRRLWSLYLTLVDTHVILAQKASIEPEKDLKTMLQKHQSTTARGDQDVSALVGRFR